MSAFPFGDHPTFAAYQAWAREQGCTVECGVSMRHGRSVRLTRILTPEGQWVIDVGTQDDDYLVPTTVARLDRRLGLSSPFAKVSIDDE